MLLAAADGLIDTSRPIKGKPAGTSLKDLGFNQVGMDEGWAACPPAKGPPGKSHGRDPSVDPRAAAERQQVDAPFSIGGEKTAMYHRLNPDGKKRHAVPARHVRLCADRGRWAPAGVTISPVVDNKLFPDMKGLVDKIHAKVARKEHMHLAHWISRVCSNAVP